VKVYSHLNLRYKFVPNVLPDIVTALLHVKYLQYATCTKLTSKLSKLVLHIYSSKESSYRCMGFIWLVL